MSSTAFARRHEPAARHEGIHLLLVDDDQVYRHLCLRHLKHIAMPGLTTDTACSISEAFELCLHRHYDCLLVDYRLPDGYGTDVVNRLGEHFARKHSDLQVTPPTIIVTADTGQHAATQAIRAGAVDFLAKRDVTPRSLQRAVSHAVERSRLEQSVVERTLALEQAYTLLENANEQLESKRRELLNFYHTVSHEVKTPLAAAREFVSLLRDGVAGSVNAQQTALLDHAMNSCDQIRSQFTELLDLARMDNDKLQLSPTLTTLEPLIERSMASVSEMAREKHMTLHRSVPESGIRVRCDVDRIVQVLSNLLSNAVKFTPDGGSVTLSLKDVKQDGKVLFQVADTGCGIEERHQRLIFERLFQVEDNELDGRHSGLGLGLSICQELLALHDSRLQVHSVPGSGSRFTFELARVDDSHNEIVKDT